MVSTKQSRLALFFSAFFLISSTLSIEEIKPEFQNSTLQINVAIRMALGPNIKSITSFKIDYVHRDIFAAKVLTTEEGSDQLLNLLYINCPRQKDQKLESTSGCNVINHTKIKKFTPTFSVNYNGSAHHNGVDCTLMRHLENKDPSKNKFHSLFCSVRENPKINRNYMF